MERVKNTENIIINLVKLIANYIREIEKIICSKANKANMRELDRIIMKQTKITDFFHDNLNNVQSETINNFCLTGIQQC